MEADLLNYNYIYMQVLCKDLHCLQISYSNIHLHVIGIILMFCKYNTVILNSKDYYYMNGVLNFKAVNWCQVHDKTKQALVIN